MSNSDRTQQHLYELNTEARLTRLESIDEAILKTLSEIKQDMKQGFDRIDSRIDKVDSRLWQLMFLIPAPIIGLAVGKFFHWF